MSSPELIAHASEATANVLSGVREEHMTRTTACDDFTVRQLVDHLAGVLNSSAAAATKSGPPDATDPAELLGDDPGAALSELSARMAEEWRTPGSFDGRTHFGTREMSAYMAGTISFFETLVHGWDLAGATGQTLELPDELSEAALATAEKICNERAREYGAFGPEVTVSEDSTPFDRALGLSGRDPNWSA